jgi:hypothetical protein
MAKTAETKLDNKIAKKSINLRDNIKLDCGIRYKIVPQVPRYVPSVCVV